MRPGPKPKGKVDIAWSPRFAYAVGLLTADGCLSKDGRHIDMTSKDRALVDTFNKCLRLKTKIAKKYSGSGNLSYHTQFSDVLFYRFLVTIGIGPAKSKTISSISVPDDHFIDFLRGYFDGDGSSYSYFDSKYKNSYRFCLSFTSASPEYLHWLRSKILERIGSRGYLSHNRHTPYLQLKYAKTEAVRIANLMYHTENVPCLRRKRTKIRKSLKVIAASLHAHTSSVP